MSLPRTVICHPITRRCFRNLLIDSFLLFLSYAILALISLFLGAGGLSYVKINLLLSVLFLPGWLLSHQFLDRTASLLERHYVGSILSFALYAAVAFTCYLCDFGFTVFYAVYLGWILLIAAWVFPSYESLDMRAMMRGVRPSQAILTILALILVVLLYRVPFSNDASQFFLQIEDMAVHRSFQVSTIGMSSFGIEEAMPRWRAHLFHVFHALMVDLTRYDPRAASTWLIAIPFGALMITAMAYFLRSVVGKSIPFALILFAIICPFTLFHINAVNCHHYYFRLLNDPGLDKDFSLYYVLPTMLYLSIRFLRAGGLRWIAVLLAFSIPALYFHPLTPVYFLMSLFPVMVGFWSRHARARLTVVGLYGALLMVLAVGTGNAQDAHREIEDIIRHDYYNHTHRHYWKGHYTAIEGNSSDSIIWQNGHMRLRAKLFTSNSVISYSAFATIAWLMLLAIRKYDGCAIAAAESRSLKVQLAYGLILVFVFVLSPFFLQAAPYLWRGYERLHWMYFGLFPFIYLPIHLLNGTVFVLSIILQKTSARSWARTCVYALALVVLIVHLVDQSWALYRRRPSMSGRIPGCGSYVDDFPQKLDGIYALTQLGPWRNWQREKPYWLESNDIVLLHDRRPEWLRKDCFWLQNQGAYWREVFVEGYVYARKGEPFLKELDAVYDGFDGEVSARFLDWLRWRGVTVLVSFSPEFVQRVATAGGYECLPIEAEVWRIVARPFQSDGKSKTSLSGFSDS